MTRLLLVPPAVLILLSTTALATPPPPNPDTKEAAKAINAFAFDLYGQLRKQDGNLFLSPHSIETALAMTYAGAHGRTAAQMAQVLHLPWGLKWEPDTGKDGKVVLRDEQAPWPAGRLHAAFGSLQADLSAPGKPYELAVANRLWGQEGFEFLPEFLGLVKTHYGAGTETLDFAGATEAARKTINAWVEKQTRDKIKDLLKPGVLDTMTRLVLTNAIYFKSKWAAEFDKKATREEDFFLVPGKKIKAPLMHKTADFTYAQEGFFQALDLPYKGEDLSMLVLLPEHKDGLPALEKWLSAGNLAGVVARLRNQEVNVTLPKFKTTAEFALVPALSALGMTDAFDAGAADFSRMDGKKDLFITAVVHKAFVDVNEEGTEAAAATGVVVGITAMPPEPKVFRADHPFLFLVRHRPSGAILFLGRLADPTA